MMSSGNNLQVRTAMLAASGGLSVTIVDTSTITKSIDVHFPD
jgi:hypothetical protein